VASGLELDLRARLINGLLDILTVKGCLILSLYVCVLIDKLIGMCTAHYAHCMCAAGYAH